VHGKVVKNLGFHATAQRRYVLISRNGATTLRFDFTQRRNVLICFHATLVIPKKRCAVAPLRET